jgi:hypothetical protein
MKVPFKITLEGETTEVPFQALSSLLAGTVLRRVAWGPLVFAGDTPSTTPKAAVIVRNGPGLRRRADRGHAQPKGIV